MKKSRFTEDQIIGVLKEVEAGMKVADICRNHGISDATFYNWRSRYSGMDVTEARRLRKLEEENQRLRRLVANLSSDKALLQGAGSQHYPSGWSSECAVRRPSAPNAHEDASGRNASTHIDSCRSRTPDAKSRSGTSTIARRSCGAAMDDADGTCRPVHRPGRSGHPEEPEFSSQDRDGNRADLNHLAQCTRYKNPLIILKFRFSRT